MTYNKLNNTTNNGNNNTSSNSSIKNVQCALRRADVLCVERLLV